MECASPAPPPPSPVQHGSQLGGLQPQSWVCFPTAERIWGLPYSHLIWEAGLQPQLSLCWLPSTPSSPTSEPDLFSMRRKEGPTSATRRGLSREGDDQRRRNSSGKKEGEENGEDSQPGRVSLPWECCHLHLSDGPLPLLSCIAIIYKRVCCPFQSSKVSLPYLSLLSAPHLEASLENTNQTVSLPCFKVLGGFLCQSGRVEFTHPHGLHDAAPPPHSPFPQPLHQSPWAALLLLQESSGPSLGTGPAPPSA